MIKFEQIVALDLEQCCWEERNPGEIIQIGLAVLDVKTGTVGYSRSDYIIPEQDDVSAYCTELTGITAQKLSKQGRKLEDALASIYQKVGANKLYLAWGDDFSVLKRECQKKNIDFKFNSTVDLSLLFHFHHMQKQSFPGKLNLEKALEMHGLSFEGKIHNAEIDAKNTARLAFCFLKSVGMIVENPFQSKAKLIKI